MAKIYFCQIIIMKYNCKNIKDVFQVKTSDGLKIENRSSQVYTVKCNKIYLNLQRKQLKISFKADIIEGASCQLEILNRKNQILHVVFPDESFYLENAPRIFKVAFSIMPDSVCVIKNHTVNEIENYRQELEDYFCLDSIIISPGYPSKANKYFWAFVHSRVRFYNHVGRKYCIAVPSNNPNMVIQEFENVKVCKLNFFDLRELLQKKFFKKIIVHFLTDEIAQILASVYLNDSRVYIYCHSSDLLYRDMNKLSTPYFRNVLDISSDQEKYYKFKDQLVRKFNNKKNIKFIFGTKWAKETSEHENNITYTNSEIIPCPVDEKIFVYHKREAEKRKNIVIIRKFDNINTYGIDINVKCILELSKRPFFDDLTINIYGDGDYHKVLLAPLTCFKNVHIHKYFLSHEEMAKVHKENGIALFGTRYETQGIAAAEAAMSGLVVLTNNVAAVSNVFDTDMLLSPEDYVSMADKIEFLYYHPDAFVALSEKMHNCVLRTCGLNVSLNKELELFEKDDADTLVVNEYPEPENNIVLTVIVPSYNAQQWLRHGVETVISAKCSGSIEVIIVNDGSKDNTQQIAESIQKATTKNGKSLVRVINKENGGHGSTINVGIAEARGKYLKIMDADDYFNTEELEKLIPVLINEDSDIVLTNYVEDWSTNPRFIPILNYEFMQPGKQYNLEDLCFEGYGFNRYANILHTSTYKTAMLKNANIKISEHCFYVDMEMNAYSFMLSKTVAYYPINLYVYYLGRSGQSVSPASFKKNYLQHEHVTLKIIKEIDSRQISYAKKNCLYRTIVLPMVETQYYICEEYLDNNSAFLDFDKKIKEYPQIYNDPFILTERTRYHRATNGKYIARKTKFK